MSTTRAFRRTTVGTAVAIALSALFIAPAQADITVAGDVQARLGAMNRSGDWAPGYNTTDGTVDGLFALFLSATKDLKGGYTAGFNCVTVATTSNGANAAFVPSALPVKHNWDGYFAGQDNYAQNVTHGGFSSYGDVNGDSKGVMCNDEVYGSLETPFGRFAVGNIMNPMRTLYDNTTVDPVWGNQRGYYDVADIRGNALRYTNSWGGFGMDVQVQTSSNLATPDTNEGKGYSLTGVVSYDFGNGTVISGGYLMGDGTFEGKYVNGSAAGNQRAAYGLAAKTRLGPVNVGYTYTGGYNRPDNFDQYGTKDMLKEDDQVIKVSYDVSGWSLQGFASYNTTKHNTPAAWGAAYTVQDGGAFDGKTFSQVKMTRTGLDFWALYSLGNGAQPYMRLNTVSKKYTTPELDGYSSKVTATKVEAGWLMHF